MRSRVSRILPTGGHAWQGGCVAGGMHSGRGVHGRGCMMGVRGGGACMAGGVHGRGHAW